MKKRDKYSKFIDWCLNEAWRIQKHLDLTSYRISLKLKPEEKIEDDFAFEINIKFPYQEATLKWTENTYKDWLDDKKKVTKYLLHEMLHILLQPLYEAAADRFTTPKQLDNLNEELTDKLTNILEFWIKKAK